METKELELISLEGGPTERGRQHGEMLRDKIGELLDRWDEALGRVYGLSRASYLDRFFAHTDFEATLLRFAPRVLEEVRGIAEAARTDYETLLAFQHINEEFWIAPPQPDTAGAEACSTIALAASREQPTLVAQNLDLNPYLDGYQILLRSPCDSSDGRILAVSVPGMVSLNGMNTHGFAVCDNALPQLRRDGCGLPVFALYRLLLESRSIREAVEILTRIPHASGLNWVMGDPLEVLMMECSSATAVRYGSDDPNRPIYHTNHPLKNVDFAPAFMRRYAQSSAPRPARSSYLRFAALHERLGTMQHRPNIDAIKSILASRDDTDYPVSRGGGHNEEDEQTGFTLASCIFELHAGASRLHIAPGPPHLCSFRTFGP